MERLGVVRYEKDAQPSGIRVSLALPTADPTRRQPVEATAATEAEALALALQRGEAWLQKR
jgi:hypothetical protein